MSNNPYSVLLVDDDQDVLDSYSYLMNISSIKSKAINDPTQALQYVSPEWAGVVILDMYMPQMHGLELLRMIKNVDERIPVIVITGHGDIPMAVDAVKQGACEFLEKPINPAELLTLVKQQLETRSSQVELQLQAEKSISRSLLVSLRIWSRSASLLPNTRYWTRTWWFMVSRALGVTASRG